MRHFEFSWIETMNDRLGSGAKNENGNWIVNRLNSGMFSISDQMKMATKKNGEKPTVNLLTWGRVTCIVYVNEENIDNYT